MRAGGRTDMNKLTVACRNFAKVPTKGVRVLLRYDLNYQN
jgi:hypothetical protein